MSIYVAVGIECGYSGDYCIGGGSIGEEGDYGFVVGTGYARLCYSALWYFPALMAVSGIMTIGWGCWVREKVGRAKARWQRRRRMRESETEAGTEIEVTNCERGATGTGPSEDPNTNSTSLMEEDGDHQTVPAPISEVSHKIPVKANLFMTLLFLGSPPKSFPTHH